MLILLPLFVSLGFVFDFVLFSNSHLSYYYNWVVLGKLKRKSNLFLFKAILQNLCGRLWLTFDKKYYKFVLCIINKSCNFIKSIVVIAISKKTKSSSSSNKQGKQRYLSWSNQLPFLYYRLKSPASYLIT